MSKKHRRAARRVDAQIEESRAARTRASHPLDNWLLGLAVAGIALTSYLTFIAWFGQHPAFCGADSECDLVQQSRWSTLLGAPIALWGLATYALLARLVWRLRSHAGAWRMALAVAGVGAAVSWYLTAVSVLVIEATCAYCLASFGIANALLALLLLRRPAHMPENAWAKSLPVPVGASVVIVLALFLHFSGLFDPAAGPEKPYLKALAVHLRESGARFYGAYWCPTCQKQKALFESSVHRLPYVECSPNGRGGVGNFDCISNDIQDYPTWVIDGRRYTGLLSVSQLATLSRFKEPGDGARKE
jgi:uncharacterized membrane protein